MRHQEFLAGVATRGGFADNDDARRAADAVLATLADHLPGDDRDALAKALPNLLEQEAGVDRAGGGAGSPTGAGLVDEVALRSGWAPERARYALTAVIGQLSAEDADLGERVRRIVPEDLHGSGPTLPPDAASEGAQGRPQPVDPDELERVLDRLTAWSGDVAGIERTVQLPSEHLDLVLERLHAAESEIGARLRIVDRTPTSLTVRARTESMEAVAAVDLDLAERFDDIVATVGSAA